MTLTTMLFAGVVLPFVRRKPPEDPRRDPPQDDWREEFIREGGCLLPNPVIVEPEPPPSEPDDGNGIDCALPAYVVEDEPPLSG